MWVKLVFSHVQLPNLLVARPTRLVPQRGPCKTKQGVLFKTLCTLQGDQQGSEFLKALTRENPPKPD